LIEKARAGAELATSNKAVNMPITSKVDRLNNLTTFIVTNELSADLVVEAMKPLYENPEHPPTLNILWDLREIDPAAAITDVDLRKIVTYLSIHDTKRVGGKTAIVARSDFEFDVSKKYELFTQLKGISVTVEVFRSLGEAMIWLGLC
jgi:hypothetical protein